MKVKMTTNFKTSKYGFLNNTKIYDVDVDDAKFWIKNGYAIQQDLDTTIQQIKMEDELVSKEVVCSKEELKLKGLREAKSALRRKATLKKNMIKANSKNKEDEKTLIKEEILPIEEEIKVLDEKIKKAEEKLKKE